MAADSLRTQLIAGVVSVRLEAPERRQDLPGDPASTWAVLADLAAGVELGDRRRFELRRIATLSQVYLRLFLPPEPWVLEDATAGDDLVWTSGDSSFADVLVSTGPDAAVFSRESRSASANLLDAGVPAVRLVKLTAPLNSLLRTSRHGPPDRLADSDLWFGPELVDPKDVVAAAMGGAS